jgi:CTP:molybdopterin cytidylyltransferase MocA
MEPIGGLVLAAGEGRRFGGAKQLATYRGRPLLEHALSAMAAARVLSDRLVVLGARANDIIATVDLHGARPLIATDWAAGQAASLRAGIAALSSTVDAIVITLGDQPNISPAAIEAVIAARDPTRFDAVRATYGARPGHPVLLERTLFGASMSLQGDQGARNLLAGARTLTVACDGRGSDLDIDLREQINIEA